MRVPRIVAILLICLVFIVCTVAQAVLAIYIFFSNIFTSDIKFVLVGCIAALMLFTVYLFVLKITSYGKGYVPSEPKKKVRPKRKRTTTTMKVDVSSTQYKNHHHQRVNQEEQGQQGQQTDPPTPIIPQQPPYPETHISTMSTESTDVTQSDTNQNSEHIYRPVFQKQPETAPEPKMRKPVFGSTESNQGGE